jgi:hypothetical protein
VAAPAVFAAFTIIALFSSLVPSFLRDILHEGNHAVSGAIAFLPFAVGAAAQVGPPRRLSSPVCLITGLIALLATLALMQAGLAYSNLAAFVLGAVVGGFAVGLTFMGSLALIRGCRTTPGCGLSRADVSAGFTCPELGKCCHGTAFQES